MNILIKYDVCDLAKYIANPLIHKIILVSDMDVPFHKVSVCKEDEINDFITPYDVIYTDNLDEPKILPKIAHIGMWSFFDGDQYDCEYRFLDWTNYSHNYKLTRKIEFEKKCMELAEWADYVFIHTQCDVIPIHIIEEMAKLNKNITEWTGDKRSEIPSWMINVAPYCITMFNNQTDVDTIRRLGHKAEFFQTLFSEWKYNPKGKVEKREPVIFMGNNYCENGIHAFPLGKERQDMALFLMDNYKKDFGLYGNGWDGLESGNLMDDWETEASIYRGAKIGINYSQFNDNRYSSDRIMRIMGSGCFCLSHHFKDIEKDFKIGVHIETFNNFAELKEKIGYYLVHDEERNKIAKSGCRYVHNNYASHRLLSTLFSLPK